MNWEYTYVKGTTAQIQELIVEANKLGAIGWEVCGFAFADPTVGVNSFTMVLKRPALELPAPAEPGAAWLQDPTRRHAYRYFDGLRWTDQVSDAGERSTDTPSV